jgi:hypothetical protein
VVLVVQSDPFIEFVIVTPYEFARIGIGLILIVVFVFV